MLDMGTILIIFKIIKCSKVTSVVIKCVSVLKLEG